MTLWSWWKQFCHKKDPVFISYLIFLIPRFGYHGFSEIPPVVILIYSLVSNVTHALYQTFRKKLRMWWHLLKKPFTENFIFCAVKLDLSGFPRDIFELHLELQFLDFKLRHCLASCFIYLDVFRCFTKLT